MRLINRQEIDDEKWNACVQNASVYRHYALTYYLDSVSDKWFGLVGEDYSWVWPIPIKSGMVKRVFQPLLAQQLGPYGYQINRQIVAEGLDFIKKNYWGINIKFNEAIGHDMISNPIVHRNIELNLSRDYSSLKKAYNRNAKSNITKALDAKVEVRRDLRYVEEVISLFQNGKGKSISILDEAFYRQVNSVCTAFGQRGELELHTAFLNQQMIAGLILLISNDRLLLFFSGSNTQARKVGAMHYLIDSVIKRYSGGHTVLDFEGSNDTNLAYFYNSFGGEEKVYLQFQKKWNIPIFY